MFKREVDRIYKQFLIVVVMCTYNGEKYITEQLESLRLQSKMPDEVLIIDDNSKDNTYFIIVEYINKFNLFHWKVIKNNCNIGWRKNYYRIINLVKSPEKKILFLADQDDIWDISKIEIMYMEIIKNCNILLLASNYTIKCENVTQNYRSNFDNNGKVLRVSSMKNIIAPQRPGCTYCFRGEIIPYFKQCWVDSFSHDALLWQISFLMGRLYISQNPLIIFRRHDNNASPRFTGMDQINLRILVLEKLSKFSKINNNLVEENMLKHVIRMLEFYNNRKQALQLGKINKMIKLFFYYDKYNSFPKQYLGDWFYFIFGKSFRD